MAVARAKKRAAKLIEAASFRATLNRIEQHASSGSGGLVVSAPPIVGCSTLLLHFYETCFQAGTQPIPIYLAVEFSETSPVDSAKRMAVSFLTQVVAFRRREIEFSTISIGPDEIARLAAVEDIAWIDRALERLNERSGGTNAEMIGRYLSVFQLAESAGLKVCIIFDNLHQSLLLDHGNDLIEGLLNHCRRSSSPTVIAGRRRFVSEHDDFDRIDLNPPTKAESAKFASDEATENLTMIDDATCDLLAVQFGSRPGFLTAILRRLASGNQNISGFPAIQRAYVEELLTASIGRWFQREINGAISNHKQKKLIELLANFSRNPSESRPIESFQRSLQLNTSEFEQAISILNSSEILRITSNRIEPDHADMTLDDYLDSRNRLENLGEPRSVVVSQTLVRCIGRSPAIMASTYRASTALGLVEILRRFDGRSIPFALLDPKIFGDRYKGKTEEEIADGLKTDSDVFTLPFIVFTASTESAYRPIASIIAAERSAFASGFRDRNCNADDEIYLLTAEIDAKLPATREQTEFWCDRLEAAAAASNFRNFKIWLVAPDGFDDEAANVLAERGALGSGRRQAEMLSKLLTVDHVAYQSSDSEYEIVIPMGEESELIAAHTLEDIGKKHGIKSHEINQIKTALVEACINASEHSHSPDGRIRQKFAVGQDRITITVSNRGVRLADAELPADGSRRRGWGLKLIEKLMDEVQIAQTDDGTILSMTKHFAKA